MEKAAELPTQPTPDHRPLDPHGDRAQRPGPTGRRGPRRFWAQWVQVSLCGLFCKGNPKAAPSSLMLVFKLRVLASPLLFTCAASTWAILGFSFLECREKELSQRRQPGGGNRRERSTACVFSGFQRGHLPWAPWPGAHGVGTQGGGRGHIFRRLEGKVTCGVALSLSCMPRSCKGLSASQQENPHQKATLKTPRIQTPSLQECEKQMPAV